MKRQKKYSPEFKARAVELAKEVGNIAEAARKLGVGKGVLHRWIYAGDAPMPVQDLSTEEKLRHLEKENAELKKANFILKQAAAFFSQDHLK